MSQEKALYGQIYQVKDGPKYLKNGSIVLVIVLLVKIKKFTL